MKTRKRVLVVDDEADQLQTLCRGLLYLGHACLPVRTAAEALAELAGAGGERIDLLLADLSAPGKPGALLLRQVGGVRPALPVLLVTGLALSSEVIALADRGLPILRKPFTPDQLGRAIETAMNRGNDQKEK